MEIVYPRHSGLPVGSHMIKRIPDNGIDIAVSSKVCEGRDLMSFSPKLMSGRQDSNNTPAQNKQSIKSAENCQANESTVAYSTDYNCTLNNRSSHLIEENETVNNRSYSDAAKGLNGPNDINQFENELPQSKIPVLVSTRKQDRNNSHPTFVSSVRTVRNIPLSDSSGTAADADNDDDFVTHIRRRTKRFYVGGFFPSITEGKIVNYAKRNGVHVTWVNIRRYERQNRAVVRVNVDSKNGFRLLERGFWPTGVTCRPWYSKGQFENRYLNPVNGKQDRNTGRGDINDAYNDAHSEYGDGY